MRCHVFGTGGECMSVIAILTAVLLVAGCCRSEPVVRPVRTPEGHFTGYSETGWVTRCWGKPATTNWAVWQWEEKSSHD